MSPIFFIDEAVVRALNNAAATGFALLAVAAASWVVYLLGGLVLLPIFLERERKNGLFISARIAGGTMLAFAIKTLIGSAAFRPRPFVALADITRLVEKSADSPAFPSGHATAAFAIAFGLFLWNRRIGIVALILATIVSVGRVAVGVHYPTDVLGGAVLGSVTSWIGWMIFLKERPSKMRV